MHHEWHHVDRLASALEAHIPTRPELVLVLGSGLGQVARSLENRITVPARLLPGYPLSTVEGHAGEVCQGVLGGKQVMILSGRVHLYEGHDAAMVCRPLRAAVTRGAKIVVLTNAAGGVNPQFPPGTLMALSDHLNLQGTSPLLGPNDDNRGLRFPDMSDVYNAKLRAHLCRAADHNGIRLEQGVYAGLLGPAYETPAEIRMISTLGADAVGMSTVQEAIAAHHLGAKVVALSCITNAAAGISNNPLNHDEVKAVGAQVADMLSTLIITFVKELS